MDIHGGEVWVQKDFPCNRCYLVYLGPDWCRIHVPTEQGNIAWADMGGKWQYTTEEMKELLYAQRYTLDGQFSDLLKEQLEAAYTSGTGDS